MPPTVATVVLTSPNSSSLTNIVLCKTCVFLWSTLWYLWLGNILGTSLFFWLCIQVRCDSIRVARFKILSSEIIDKTDFWVHNHYIRISIMLHIWQQCFHLLIKTAFMKIILLKNQLSIGYLKTQILDLSLSPFSPSGLHLYNWKWNSSP